jgi:cation diffusion facilitator CzcD-associated flavoprotein CzcO
VCVVGAGPGGLAAAAAFKRRGLAFDIVDAGRGPGGIWDIGRDETPMYRSAHFISSRTLSGFRDFPMPASTPDYPRHDLVLDYVRAYARHHDLERHATFGVRVTRAHPEAGGWAVELDSGERRRYRELCVATGASWHPHLPVHAGDFEGEAYHVFHYRSPAQLRGKRVLIVGGGNSGCDIACDAAQVAERAFLSLRRGYHFVPKYVFGRPSDVFAHGGPPLPSWLEQRLFGFLLDRVLVGDLTRFGLPRPDHRILASHPIMNTQILHHLGHGDLVAVPDVRELRRRSVVFADGREEAIDLIVWATGYERVYPFLELPEAKEDGAPGGGGPGPGSPPLDLYLNVFHRTRPDLSVVGLFETDGAAYGLLSLQGEMIAGYAEARARGVDTDAFDALRRSARPDLRGGRRYLTSQRHRYYVREAVYRRTLERVGRRFGWVGSEVAR